MKHGPPVGSGLAKVLFAFGLLALFAAVCVPIVRGPAGPLSATSAVVVALLAAGVALIGGAIALDRAACRKADREAVPGFDVIVRPEGKESEH